MDSSRPIRTLGHAKKCLKAICRIIREDYGPTGCTDPHHAHGLFVAYASLEDAAHAADPAYKRTLRRFAARRLIGFSFEEQVAALAQLRVHRFTVTSRSLGELLGLTDARRDLFKFWDAEAIDMSPEAVASKRKAQAAAYARAYRQKKGATPRAECPARLRREQHSDVPVSTFYARLAGKSGGSP